MVSDEQARSRLAQSRRELRAVKSRTGRHLLLEAGQDVNQGGEAPVWLLNSPSSNPFGDLLPSLPEQLELIDHHNVWHWDFRLGAEQLAVDTASDHTQRIDDFEFLHVHFRSLEETARLLWRVIKEGSSPCGARWSKLRLRHAFEYLQLLESNVRIYEPGTITRVRTNLVANWDPKHRRTLEQVRQRAQEEGRTLAQLEVLSACAWLPALMRRQDGVTLPYMEVPGIDLSLPGDSTSSAPHVRYIRGKANLCANRINLHTRQLSAPVILG